MRPFFRNILGWTILVLDLVLVGAIGFAMMERPPISSKVVINASDVKDRQDLHRILKEKMGFPADYAGNLDALWTELTSAQYCGKVDIEIENEDDLVHNPGIGEEYARELMGLLSEAPVECGKAEPTVFRSKNSSV